MRTATAAAARRARTGRLREHGTTSRIAAAEVADLLALPPDMRRQIIGALPQRDLAVLLAAVEKTTGSPLGLYADDPIGFVTDVLGETLWSRQRDILAALTTAKEVIVPAGFSVGKLRRTWRREPSRGWCVPSPSAPPKPSPSLPA